MLKLYQLRLKTKVLHYKILSFKLSCKIPLQEQCSSFLKGLVLNYYINNLKFKE